MDPSGSTIVRGQGLSLIGYRASGKSTVARLVADALDRPCIDVDREVERRAGKSIPEIFLAEGESSFRDLEERALRDLCQEFPNAVLATGGGAILRSANRETLRPFGLAIWLKAPSEVLVDRLRRDPSARPSLTGAGLLDEVDSVLKTREPLYESVADLVVDATPEDPSIVAETLLRQIALFGVQKMILLSNILGGLWIFLVGATVGSFANVCIYRIPWQKSVIWPGSHCPRCLTSIRALDNIPIFGWIALRGRCRACQLPIASRYPLIELLTGLLFVAVYLAELMYPGRSLIETLDLLRVAYHLILVALLVIATFIDYDYTILPDEITLPGMAAGLALGALVPQIRPAPGTMTTALDGFLFGFYGLLIGGGLIWAIRILGRLVFRREAMGFGDVTLMAMIGSFLGWQILPPTLFLAAFLGLIHALLKVLNAIRKWVTGRQLTGADREIPFGPYLSMAALILMLGWTPMWTGWLSQYYSSIGDAVRFLVRREF